MSANNVASLESELGNLPEAVALHRSTLAAQRRVLGDDHDATILSLGNLGSVLTKLGRAAEAEPLFIEAVERCHRTLGTSHRLCGNTLRKQGRGLVALKRYADAERALEKAYRVLSAAHGVDHPATALAAANLVELYEAWGRPAVAAAWREGARSDQPAQGR